MTPELLWREERCISCGQCDSRTEYEKCPTLALEMVGKNFSSQKVLEIAKQDTLFYDESGGGVTFTGGEPLSQPEFLSECLLLCKEQHIHTAVDTSGFAPSEVMEKIAPLTDLFLYDLKHPDPLKHKHYTGVGNKLIIDNLLLLDKIIDVSGLKTEIHIRIPLIPTVNMDEETLGAMAELITKLRNISKVILLPYHTAGKVKYAKWNMAYKMDGVEAPSKKEIEQTIQILADNGVSNLQTEA